MVLTFYSKKAFTLVELLVVIAIVGLLSTIVLVSTSGLREQAEIAKTLTWAKSIDSLLGADAVGIWNMDETSASNGTQISDIFGWGNDGTLVTNNGTDSKSVPGVVNGALSFDGDGDYVDCGIGASLNITGTITLEAWVKTSISGSKFIARGTTSANHTYALGSSDGHIMFHWANGFSFGAADFVGGITAITDGNWHHLVAVGDPVVDMMYVYVDGKLDNSRSKTTVPTSNTTTVTIGTELGYTTLWTDGLIDEVRIYNQALTASQIQSQYYAGLNKLLAKGLIDEIEYQERLVLK